MSLDLAEKHNPHLGTFCDNRVEVPYPVPHQVLSLRVNLCGFCLCKVDVFQRDRATSHTSRATHSHLEDSTPSFIKNKQWPPQSPDCNPMNYNEWDSLSWIVYCGRTTVFKEKELKDAIRQKWREIPQDEVRKAISF